MLILVPWKRQLNDDSWFQDWSHQGTCLGQVRGVFSRLLLRHSAGSLLYEYLVGCPYVLQL